MGLILRARPIFLFLAFSLTVQLSAVQILGIRGPWLGWFVRLIHSSVKTRILHQSVPIGRTDGEWASMHITTHKWTPVPTVYPIPSQQNAFKMYSSITYCNTICCWPVLLQDDCSTAMSGTAARRPDHMCGFTNFQIFCSFLLLSLRNNLGTFHEASAFLKTTLMFTIWVQIAIVFAVLFLKWWSLLRYAVLDLRLVPVL